MDKKAHRWLIINGMLFCIGFSIVFIALGATATALGGFLQQHATVIKYVSGGLIVAFGVIQTGIVRLAFFNREKRFEIKNRAPGIVTSLLMGMAFGFGWTPCIGPVLVSVLLLAAQQASLWQGMGLLAVYSLGMLLPFMLIAVFLRLMTGFLNFMKKHARIVKNHQRGHTDHPRDTDTDRPAVHYFRAVIKRSKEIKNEKNHIGRFDIGFHIHRICGMRRYNRS